MMRGNRIYPGAADYEDYTAAQSAFQHGCLAQDEEKLRTAGVPSRFWVYVVCNANPRNWPNPAERIGTWWDSRDYAVKDIVEFSSKYRFAYTDPENDALYYGVVDGRDRAAIMAYIAGTWINHAGDAWWAKKMEGMQRT